MMAQKVEGHLKKCGIPKTWIGSCTVTYKFNTEYIRKYHYWGSALGTHFLCSITIETDLGKQYTSLMAVTVGLMIQRKSSVEGASNNAIKPSCC